MKKRLRTNAVVAVALLLLLSGCMGGLKSETIVIPDSAEAASPDEGDEPFRVKTIYRLPSRNEKVMDLLYWGGADSAYRIYWNDKGRQSLARLTAPFEEESEIRLNGPDRDVPIHYDSVSPDGRYAAGLRPGESGDELVLARLSDRRLIDLPKPDSSRLYSKGFVWSDNGRYLSYFSYDVNGMHIVVYDAENGTSKKYALPGLERVDYVYFVKPSDDGKSAILLSESDNQANLWLGEWKQGAFEAVYSHRVGGGLQAAWIDSDRIAFAGTDGTLFTYDRRNEELAVLAGQVGSFQVSPDKQFLAYSAEDNAVYVAKLKGNNLLQATSVYQGVVPGRMAWSPDSGRLLVQGWKPYDKRVPEPAGQESQVLVSDNMQNLIIEFER